MKATYLRWLLYGALIASLWTFWVGCAEGPIAFEGTLPWGACQADDASGLTGQTQRPVTYTQHIKPLLEQHCSRCHREGANAPFVFDTYQKAVTYKHLLASVTKSRRMPPWQPSSCCNTYVDERRLSNAQIKTILSWIEQGTPRGPMPSADTPVASATPSGEVDPSQYQLRLKLPRFRPQAQVGGSELRCFLLDWPAQKEQFVTGFHVEPGDPKLVHHVIAEIVKPEHVGYFEALEREDTRPGWDCYGKGTDPRKGVGIGGWAPGYKPVNYPQGIGISVAPGSKVLVTMHYDVSRDQGEDQTQVMFKLKPQVARKAYNFGMSHPQWLFSGGMAIPKGSNGTKHYYRLDPTTMVGGGAPLTLYAIHLHIHEKGSRGTVVLERADGSKECVLHVPAFVFAWQETYTLKKPLVLQPGDRLYLECRWDNRESNQPIIKGKQKPSQTIGWGTEQEMCAAFLLLAEGA